MLKFHWRALFVLAIGSVLAGCGSRDYDGADRFALTGEVTFDGEVVDAGLISFIPTNHDEQRVSGTTIENGKYQVPEAQGANAGTYRVEIHWAKKNGKQHLDPELQVMIDDREEGLPKQFHKDSTLTAEVAPEQTTFNFHLKSK